MAFQCLLTKVNQYESTSQQVSETKELIVNKYPMHKK
jgi:hypothetical protein